MRSGKSLFVRGPFVSRAGLSLPFKIECDALGPDDWDAVAVVVAERLGPFGRVVPVPEGGVPFAAALNWHARPTEYPDVVLLCDDVLTTGGSMERACGKVLEQNPRALVLGVVLFARGQCPEWIKPVFSLSPWVDRPLVGAWPWMARFLPEAKQ